MIDRKRLAAVLGMLGSAHEGEIINAARQAERIRQEAGLTWANILAANEQQQPSSSSPPVAEEIAFVLARRHALSVWETGFIDSIQRRRNPLTPKQRETLDRIVEKVRYAKETAA